MTTKNLFTTVAILCMLFGLGLTFAPNFMGEQYLTNPAWINEGAKLLAQGWGTLLMTTAVACWYVRDMGSSSGGRVMLLFSLLSNAALIVIHVLAVVNGVETALGWAQVLLAIVLAGWAGMLFRQESNVVA